MIKHLVLVSLLVSLSACASVFEGNTQKVKVEVINVANNKYIPEARCTITDEMNAIYLVTENPSLVKIKKGQGTLQVDCKKEGFIQKNSEVRDSFDSTAFLNVFTGGVGFFVDAVSGAMLPYPSHIVIRMVEDK